MEQIYTDITYWGARPYAFCKQRFQSFQQYALYYTFSFNFLFHRGWKLLQRCFTDFSQRRHKIFCYFRFIPKQCYRNPALGISVQPQESFQKPHGFVLAPKYRPVSFTSPIKGVLFYETEPWGNTSICTEQDFHSAAGNYSNCQDVSHNFVIAFITHCQEAVSSSTNLLRVPHRTGPRVHSDRCDLARKRKWKTVEVQKRREAGYLVGRLT
jgi:hypothetical protein